MDQDKIKKSIDTFMNKSNTDSYLMLVTVSPTTKGFYLVGQEFADNCGPGTNRELVGIKQADGSVHFLGSLKPYDDTPDN
jgi:hypothetical protein